MAESKTSRFEEKLGGVPAPAPEEQEYVPRVVFTKDAKPDLSKMQVPMLRIAQGMTDEVTSGKAQMGQLVLTNFPPVDEVILIPLQAQNIRTYRPDPRARPKCQSPTGEFGIGDPGIICAECPLSKWSKNPDTGKAVRPPCVEGVAVRAYSATHRCVVDYFFMGQQSGSGQFIQQQAMAFGYGDFGIKMRSQRQKNDKGTWAAPDLEMMMTVPDDQHEIAQRWLSLLMEQAETSEQAARQLGMGGGK